MIVFQVNPKCILAFPFEGDAPWTIYMNAITLWFAMQGMKIKARVFNASSVFAVLMASSRLEMRSTNDACTLALLPFSKSSSSP